MENYIPNIRVRHVNVSHARLCDEEIVRVLEMGLRQNFVEVEVKWVECPDLSIEPFNLAAPGLCGKTTVLDFGNESYLKGRPKVEKLYDIKHFLKYIGRDSNSFVFGTGISQRPSNGQLGELAINSTFRSITEINKICNNKSRILFINSEHGKCDFEKLTVFQLKCNMQGTFFLSEGTRNERVLQVYAKKYKNAESAGFTKVMCYALRQATVFTDHFVVLGGVYISYNQKWTHKLMSNEWEYPRIDTRKYNKQCTVEEPSAVISIFNNKPFIPSLSEPPLNLSFGRCVQILSHHSGNGFHDQYELSSKNGAEFLGYFCVANEVYRIE